MHRYVLSTAPAAIRGDDVSRCFGAIGEAAAPGELLRRPDCVLFAAADASGKLFQDPGGFCFLPAQPPRSWPRGEPLTAASLLAAVRRRGADAFADLLAPFAALVQPEPGAPILVAADAHGLQHVYSHARGGAALVSDSCLLLAALTGADLDPHAVLTFLRLGHYLGGDSPFAGVDKLPGGEVWQLAAGTRRASRLATDAGPALAGAECLRQCVHTQLAAVPEALVELSGGLDSRLIVAALGPDACRGRAAMTLGTTDAADVRIAEQLARHLGFDWQFVDLGRMAALPEADVMRLVRRASQRCDHTAQPLARAVLEWVNAQVPPRPRFSGQNGELARGFYYPGFADRSEVSAPLVARLLHWRLSTNDCIDRDLIDAAFWRDHEAGLQQRLTTLLRSYDRPWLAATDEFYLRERMQRWVGGAYSAETQDHAILAPFFDPRFVDWTRRLRPTDKRDSRAMARLVGELAPALAAMPTAGGLSPRVQGATDLWARGQRQARFVQKVVRKIAQRVGGARRSPVGAPALAARLLAAGVAEPATFARTTQLGWIRGEAIQAVLGRGVASWASLGQLLALEWTLEALARARS
jgi:asparagine synthase (glutamine-hydrolysing)